MAKYHLHLAHLYGDLLNTYGDIGNIIALKYYAKQMDTDIQVDVVSIEDDFDPDQFDIAFFGGGQDYEQMVVSKDIQTKKDGIKKFIEDGKPMLAICGGYQLLGKYYVGADGEKIPGIGVLDHYTLTQSATGPPSKTSPASLATSRFKMKTPVLSSTALKTTTAGPSWVKMSAPWGAS